MAKLLAQDIMNIYSAMDAIEREGIDDLLKNQKVSKSIPIGIILLLKHIKITDDKKSEWIRGALRHVQGISSSIQTIKSRTK